ncbi:hypothetical protein CPC08DRAFT_820277 [Agrocybe pediades]|nr:hypothetical protein CPC08DRAFT_820277 [Agrocybe pediades]
MAYSVGLLLCVLALGTLVAQVNGLKFNITDVQQCQPIMVSFEGTNLTGPGVPAALTVIPVNSTAISIPVDPSYIPTGIAITFLPLPAGSNFLASLDDSAGDSLIDVSDLIRVLPSSGFSNSTCLVAMRSVAQRRFSLATNVSQCEEMSIMYDTTVVSKAPSIRVFSPKGQSSLLNLTSDDPATGTAKYLMDFPRGKEVVLLMDDGNTIKETSPLITVAGDASSDSSCLKVVKGNMNTSDMNMTVDNNNPANSVSTPSRALVIGGATGGAVVVLIALSMVIFVVRDRRRRQLPLQLSSPSQLENQPEVNEKAVTSGNFTRPVSPKNPQNPRGTVFNPIYATNPAFLSPTNSKYQRGSMASWAQRIPEDQRSRISSIKPPSPALQSSRSEERLSIESLDIEGMLNMATLQAENLPRSRKNSEVTIYGHIIPLHTPTLVVPTVSRSKTQISERHLRNPSDVPAGPDSMAFSGYSVNPFDGHASITPSILQDNLVISKPSGSLLELPLSPRDGRSSNARIASGLASNRSSSDWYGIAQ